LGVQIAEAFEAAHAKGIIHRGSQTRQYQVTPEGQSEGIGLGLAKRLPRTG